MALRFGTAHFVSLNAAIRYYAPYEFALDAAELRKLVSEKVRVGEIHIGKPEVPAGGKLLVIDNGTRYAIES